MRFAIFCIVLLASANAMTLMEKYPLNFSSKRSIMAVMLQVEEMLKNGGPFDAIIDILDQFEQEIKDEQAEHTRLRAENQESCDEELALRNEAIHEANAAIKEAEQTLDSCTAQLARAESDLKASENQLANARQSLGTLERERIQERELYQKDEIAYKSLVNGIHEALEIIEQLKAGNGSFVQLAKHTNKVMLMASQTKSVAALGGVMTALVQAQGANEDAIFIKLTGLFEGFLEDTLRKQNASNEAEAAAIAHYNTAKARLTSTINHLVEQIDNLNAEIMELKQCISTQQSLLASAKSKLHRNSNLLASATSLCEKDAIKYEQQTAARKDELELLVVIKNKVHERFGQISNEHGTIDRAMMDSDEIANSFEAENTYTHKSFEGI